MALSEFIENLQNKPRPVRVLMMWISVAICMTLLLIFWVATLDFKSGIESAGQTTSDNESFSEIKNQIPTLWQSLKGGVGDLLQSGQSVAPSSPTQTEDQSSAAEIEPIQPESSVQVPPATLP